MKFGRSSLASNVLTSIGGYVVVILTTFIMAPMLIRHLGDAQYGVWSLVTELTGYYGIFDSGIRIALIYYISHYSASGETDQVNRISASGFWLLSTISAVSAIACVFLFPNLPRIMGRTAVDIKEAPAAVAILLLIVIAGLPTVVSSAVITGRLRLNILNAIEISSRVAMAAGTFIVLRSGGRLLALSLVLLGVRVGSWAVQWIAAWNVAPYLSLHPRWFHRDSVRSLLTYGSQTFFLVAAQLFIPRASSLIVGIFIGVKWVTYYTLGSMLVMYAAELCGAATRSLTPHYSNLYAQGKLDELKSLYIKSSRILASLFSFVAAGVAAFSGSFLSVWVGSRFVTGPWTQRSDVVCAILILAQLGRQFHSASWHLLLATKRQRFLMVVTAVEAAAGVTLNLVLGRYFGVAGVAMGITLPLLVTHCYFLPKYIKRSFGLDNRVYLKIFGRPLATAVVIFGLNSSIVQMLKPSNWVTFIASVALAASIGAAIFYRFGIPATDRRALRDWLAARFVQRAISPVA